MTILLQTKMFRSFAITFIMLNSAFIAHDLFAPPAARMGNVNAAQQRPGQFQPPARSPGFNPGQPSPEEMEQLQQMVKSIEDEVAKMSPAEQAAFVEKVEKTQRNLEKLPEEELKRFVEGSMSEAEMEEFLRLATEGVDLDVMPEEKPATKPEEPVAPAEVEAKVETPALNKKAESVVEMIRGIIESTESFLTKAQSIPDLDAKVVSWRKKGSLSGEEKIDWFLFRFDIEKFVQRLRSFISQDSSKQYSYLTALSAEGTLLMDLRVLANDLKTLEPSINVPPFGMGKIAKKTKDNALQIINSYLRAIKEKDLGTALDEVIAKYEPEAKKLREKLAAIEKKAAEAAKRPRRQEVVTARGSTAKQTSDTADYDYGYGGQPRYARDYSPSSYSPTTLDAAKSSQEATKPAQVPGTGAAAPTTGVKEPSKGGAPAPKERVLTETERRVARETDRLLEKFSEQISQAADLIKNNKFLQTPLANLFNETAAVDEKFPESATAIIAQLGNRKGALDTLNTLMVKAKSLPASEYAAITKEIASIWKRHEKTFAALTKQIQLIKNRLKSPGSRSKISDEKQYIYLGSATAPMPDEVDTVVKRAAAPYQDLLDQLEDLIAKLDIDDAILVAKNDALTTDPSAAAAADVKVAAKSLGNETKEVQEYILDAWQDNVDTWIANIQAELDTTPTERLVRESARALLAYKYEPSTKTPADDAIFGKVEEQKRNDFVAKIKELNDKVAELKTQFDTVKTAAPVAPASIKPADSTPQDKLAQLKLKFPAPRSLFEIGTAVQELKTAVDKVSKQAAAPKQAANRPKSS